MATDGQHQCFRHICNSTNEPILHFSNVTWAKLLVYVEGSIRVVFAAHVGYHMFWGLQLAEQQHARLLLCNPGSNTSPGSMLLQRAIYLQDRKKREAPGRDEGEQCEECSILGLHGKSLRVNKEC